MKYYFARGGSSGGHSSSSSSHASSSSSSKSSGYSRSGSTSGSKSSSSSTKPGSTIRSGTSTIKTSSAKPTNIRSGHSTGIIGANGYTQHFYGYNPPVGSVVYYPSYSFFDYLPWIYLFSDNSPHNAQATVVQPDGKQVVAQPQQGIDGMIIFNWILLVLILIGICVGIVWGVNKVTRKKELIKNESY